MLRDLVLQSRSYRSYDPTRPVTRGELESLAELARFCPSSVNRQALKYYLCSNPAQAGELLKLTRWAAGLPELSLPFPGQEPPAFIVICLDRGLADNPSMFLLDVGIAAQTMLLGAAEMGLGGCMIGNFRRKDVCGLLQLPEQLEPNLIIAIGKPAEKIILTDAEPGGSTAYYRSEDNRIHYVPKRPLDELIINRKANPCSTE